MRASPAAPTTAEAVPLVYALVSWTLLDVGIRALAVKGPVPAAQGLRAGTRASVDADVLVDPAQHDRARDLLVERGWTEVPFPPGPHLLPAHSTTLRHPAWPCEVDLHHWFPGFLGAPETAFEELWARRTSLDVAGVPVVVTDVVGSAAVAALNCLRDITRPGCRSEYDDLVERVRRWSPEQRADLSRLATASGAAEALGPFLADVGAAARPSTVPLVVGADLWALRSHERAAVRYLEGWRRTRWAGRARYLAGVLWPSRDYVRSLHGPADASWSRLTGWRLRRLRRGVLASPRAWVLTRTGRRAARGGTGSGTR